MFRITFLFLYIYAVCAEEGGIKTNFVTPCIVLIQGRAGVDIQ